MISLEKIYISNFRKFTQPVVITGLKPGLNVISGDNEDGKSTVLHAIKSAFFTKYNTSATTGIQSYNSTAMPEVQIEFQRGGELYFLRKIFGKKGLAELRSGNSLLNGPDAEDKLQELCLTGGAGNKESTSMWGVLWVEQGKAFETPQIGEEGRRTLSNALEAEVGSVLGGNDGHAIVTRISDLYHQWFTPKGQEKSGSDIKNAREQLAAIDKQYTECAAKYQEYEETVRHMAAVRDSLKKHERERSIEQSTNAVAQAEARAKDVTEKRHELSTLDQTEKTKRLEYETAAAAFRTRRDLIAELENKSKALSDLTAQLAELERQHAEASKTLFEKQQAFGQAESKHDLLLQAVTDAERVEQYMSLQAECTRLRSALTSATTADKERQGKEVEGKSIKVNGAALKQLQELHNNVLQAEMRLHAIATRIEFAPLPGQSLTDAEGNPVDASQALLLTESSNFLLAGWGRLNITPGGDDLATIKTKAAALRAQLASAFEAHAVRDMEEAIGAERRQNELRAEYVALNNSVKFYAPSGIPALQEELSRAETQFKQLAAAHPQLELSTAQPPESAEAAKQQLLRARVDRDEARKLSQELKRSSENAESEFRKIDSQQQSLVSQRGQFELQKMDCLQKLESSRTTETDELVERRMAEGKVLLDNIITQKNGVETQLKLLNADAIDGEINAARQKVQTLQAEITQLNYDQRELQGALQTFGSAGITEEVARLQGKLDQSKSAVERTEKKSRAIKLLWNTISQAEANAKRELSAPLLKHLEPFVTQVFDGGKLAFNNQDFSITHLHRDGIPEEYQKLSLGTREQLSVLTRLAFARLLTESGTPALVILDDALVYSDQGRLDRMQTVLKNASAEFQILILTCRQRDYAQLDANFVQLDNCLTTAAPQSLVLSSLHAATQSSAPAGISAAGMVKQRL